MPISSDVRKAGPFAGNDITTEFPFTFLVFSPADVLVVLADELGVESELDEVAHYTVSLNANQNANPGGTVTLNTALATNTVLVITSRVASVQPLDLTNSGGFYPAVITRALDRLTVLVQQLREQVERAPKVSITSSGGATPDVLIAQINDAVAAANQAADSAAESENNAEQAAAAAAVFDPSLYVAKAGDSISGELQLVAGNSYVSASEHMGGRPSHSQVFQAHTPIFRNTASDLPTWVGAVASGTGASAGYYAKLNPTVSNAWGGFEITPTAFRIHSSIQEALTSAPVIQFSFKGIDRVSIADTGVVSCFGVRGRQGTSGATLGSAVNLYWTGSALEVWVNTVRIGTVNITP